jgi:hypothetical protein
MLSAVYDVGTPDASSGKLQDLAILLQLCVWSSRPGCGFMVSGTGKLLCNTDF